MQICFIISVLGSIIFLAEIHYLLCLMNFLSFPWSIRVQYVTLSAISLSMGREDFWPHHGFSYWSCMPLNKILIFSILFHLFFLVYWSFVVTDGSFAGFNHTVAIELSIYSTVMRFNSLFGAQLCFHVEECALCEFTSFSDKFIYL